MKKAESEDHIRALCHVWRKATGQADAPVGDLHFSNFWRWLNEHHPSVADFKSVGGARYIAEMWFDDEFKQGWRG